MKHILKPAKVNILTRLDEKATDLKMTIEVLEGFASKNPEELDKIQVFKEQFDGYLKSFKDVADKNKKKEDLKTMASLAN